MHPELVLIFAIMLGLVAVIALFLDRVDRRR
jgi:hypothetical protein